MELADVKAYFHYMKSPKGAYEWKSYGIVIVILGIVSLVCIGAWLHGR